MLDKQNTKDKVLGSEKDGRYTVDRVVELLNELGYRRNLVLKDQTMICTESEESFFPEDLSLVGSFRFESFSDPEDISIIYAVQANNGSRGVIVDAFGTYADPEIGMYLQHVRDERRNSELMDCIPPKKTIHISAH